MFFGKKINVFFLLFAWTAVAVHANSFRISSDTLPEKKLEEAVAVGKLPSRIYRIIDGKTVINFASLAELPQMLGNPDPFSILKRLPIVQTGSELNGGLYVQGNEAGHNSVLVGGMPLYNVNHLLGFFSVFNTGHFKQLTFEPSTQVAKGVNTLGAVVDVDIDTSLVAKPKGEVTLGPLFSQGTLQIPITAKAKVIVSSRLAYLNLLYGAWLKVDETQVKYSFGDYNLSFVWQPKAKHQLILNSYLGKDYISFLEHRTNYDLYYDYGNYALSFIHHYRPSPKLNVRQMLYGTAYESNPTFAYGGIRLKNQSKIKELAYRLDIIYKRGMQLGGKLSAYELVPENIVFSQKVRRKEQRMMQKVSELSLFANNSLFFNSNTKLTIGTDYSYFLNGIKNYHRLSPKAMIEYDSDRYGKFTFSTGLNHQFIQRVGFTTMGLPTEFYFAADAFHKPASSLTTMVEYQKEKKGYRYKANLFYKSLYHLQEYLGMPFDLLSEAYQLEDYLFEGKGRNYGGSIQIEKMYGKLTGFVSYTYTKSLRSFAEKIQNYTYASSYEREHEGKLSLLYKHHKQWSFSSTLVWASGTPYTAPKGFYYLGQNLVVAYHPYNANRLPPYFRLDLGMRYKWFNKAKLERGFNFSLYNATAYPNVQYYRLKINKDRTAFALSPIRFHLPLLPSFNFYCHF